MRGFFHVALFDERSIDIYYEIVDALNRSRLAKSSEVVEVHIIGKKELVDKLLEQPLLENAIFIQHGEDLKQYEYPTMLALEAYCRSNPSDTVYYLHTKGVSKPESPVDKYWRKAMIHFVIEGWERCHNAIVTNIAQVAGYNWVRNHFSGNWWFAQATYICRLRSLESYKKNPFIIWSGHSKEELYRLQCEFWIGYGKPRKFSVGATEFNYQTIHPMFKDFDTSVDPFTKAGLELDKRYMINLLRRPDRKDEVAEELINAGIKDVLFYPGFDGKTEGWTNKKFIVNPGMSGCFLTHRAILTEAYVNQYSKVLIMEDDAIFAKGFSEVFPYIWNCVPADWELVWVGSTERNGKSKKQVKENVHIPQDVWGTQCYIISRSGIEKVCNWLFTHQMPDHIDITLTRYVPNLVQYSIMPSLVTQRVSKSDCAAGELIKV